MLKEQLKNYVIYRHRNETTNEIFYIGSGSEKRSKSIHNKTDAWKNIVSTGGYAIEIVAEDLSEDDSLDLEYLMIDSYGTIIDEDGTLVNIKRDRYKSHSSTNIKIAKSGLGNTRLLGHKHSEETRAKIGLAFKGRKHSKKTKNKMSLSKSGENNPMFGKEVSKVTRDKIALSNTGYKHSSESKAKMSLIKISLGNTGEKSYMFGKNHSEETKSKMSLAQKGKKLSESTKSKISLTRRRKFISDENWELLLIDFSKIDKIIWGVTYKELAIKFNVKTYFISSNFHKYKKQIKIEE